VKPVLKSILYLLNPLLIPLFGMLIYFAICPRFTSSSILISNALGLLITTVITPIVTLFFLKNINIIDSVQLQTLKDRKIPMLLQIGFYILTIKTLINIYNFPELYYFFAGVLFSTMSALVLVLSKFKTSLHMAGIALITTFTITLSIHFSINQIVLIAGLLVLNGLLATACMVHFHTATKELLVGIVIGSVPQLVLFQLWL